MFKNGCFLPTRRENGSRYQNPFFARYPNTFEWTRSDGGCVGYPRFLAGDTNAFCETLVEESGVLLLPPRIYRSELMAVPNDRFRVGFGRRNIEQGLGALDEYLQANGYS